MKQKILIVITKSNWGGAQRYVWDLAVNLPKDKFEVKIALGGNGVLAQKLNEESISVVNIPFLERDVGFLKDVRAFIAFWKLFRDEEPDSIHLNSSKTGALGALAAFLLSHYPFDKKFKSIFTVHGWAFNEDRNFMEKALIFFVQWLTVALTNKTIVISKQDYRQALKMPLIPKNKFEIIPLGINISEEGYAKRKARDILIKSNIVFDPETILAGTVAELTKNKGLDYFIQAIYGLKKRGGNIKAVIIGEGEDENKLKELVRRLGLESDILFAGFIADAWKLLRSFDIFVLPSLKEGLPYTILEAMAEGIPVIAASTGGIPDLIQNEKNGILVPAKNSLALENALFELMSKKTKRDSFRKAAKQTLLEKFELKEMILKTAGVYQ